MEILDSKIVACVDQSIEIALVNIVVCVDISVEIADANTEACVEISVDILVPMSPPDPGAFKFTIGPSPNPIFYNLFLYNIYISSKVGGGVINNQRCSYIT